MTTPLTVAAATCTDPHLIDLGFMQLSWLQVALLGVVQGITELLPISSTAHLRVIPGILGWPDPGSAFSAAMQLASFIAVVSYFYADIRLLLVDAGRAVKQRDFKDESWKLVVGIALGTLPLIIAGALLKSRLNQCSSPLRGLIVIGVSSLVMALLLGLSEKLASHARRFAALRFADCIWVGLAQALALIPGVSRSGATLTAGLMLGMERQTAARFSFLLGLPAITLAGLYEFWQLYKAHMPMQGWLLLAVGLATASATAFLTIYGLLKFLEHRSTWIFVVYRFLMGVGLIAAVLSGLLPN
jgi:undecaprenyl-diphosphatase